MPGIQLKDYVQGEHINEWTGETVIEIVHFTLEFFNKKRPKHSNFEYAPAGTLDSSGYDYILVVDGEWTWRTWWHKERIRRVIKRRTADALQVDEARVAVRYRLFNSSFG